MITLNWLNKYICKHKTSYKTLIHASTKLTLLITHLVSKTSCMISIKTFDFELVTAASCWSYSLETEEKELFNTSVVLPPEVELWSNSFLMVFFWLFKYELANLKFWRRIF